MVNCRLSLHLLNMHLLRMEHSQYKFNIWFFLSILHLYLFSHNKNWFLIALMFYPTVCVQ